jgi:hypothetical protein
MYARRRQVLTISVWSAEVMTRDILLVLACSTVICWSAKLSQCVGSSAPNFAALPRFCRSAMQAQCSLSPKAVAAIKRPMPGIFFESSYHQILIHRPISCRYPVTILSVIIRNPPHRTHSVYCTFSSHQTHHLILPVRRFHLPFG